MNKLKFYMKWVFSPEWADWDIYLDKWIKTDGNVETKSYVLFKIQYSYVRDKFKLKVSGYKPKKHVRYQEMVAKVYALNMSTGLVKTSFPIKETNNNIIITHFPVDTDAEKAFEMKNNHKDLVSAINKYISENLKDVEIFKQQDNIIATEKGYYGAFFERDLKQQ